MSDSMFQKDLNDQIYVKDIDIPNPFPSMLDEHYSSTDTKTFNAKPHHVLKLLYDESNSLDAFSKDTLSCLYVLFHRDTPKNRTLICHLQSGAPEAVFQCEFDQLEEGVKDFVPMEYR